MAEIKYSIEEKLVTISESQNGWTKEVNLVSWNEYPAKYDIRSWDPDHEKMSKGLTLTKGEIIELRDILNGLDI